MHERHTQILNQLELDHEVSVMELAIQNGISVETIRRDLNLLAKKGLLHRTHGGAVSYKNRDIGRSFYSRQRVNSEAKRSIADNALEYLFEGAVIGLDASSSSWNFAQKMPDIPCTVVTSSMHNIHALANKSNITTIATGGVYSAKYDAFYGPLSEHLLSRLKIDFTIFSCTGISEGTIWESNEVNAAVKRKLLSVSKQVFLFADHSKYGKKDLIQLSDLALVDILFTNAKPPEQISNYCHQHDILITY